VETSRRLGPSPQCGHRSCIGVSFSDIAWMPRCTRQSMRRVSSQVSGPIYRCWHDAHAVARGACAG
jgi:hypothetical protein